MPPILPQSISVTVHGVSARPPDRPYLTATPTPGILAAWIATRHLLVSPKYHISSLRQGSLPLYRWGGEFKRGFPLLLPLFPQHCKAGTPLAKPCLIRLDQPLC